ncbi:MAG: hypothetical protein EOM66_11765 [Clostridia bacterium]|nr:hypothetical protein [Clostridia bacterium]
MGGGLLKSRTDAREVLRKVERKIKMPLEENVLQWERARLVNMDENMAAIKPSGRSIERHPTLCEHKGPPPALADT